MSGTEADFDGIDASVVLLGHGSHLNPGSSEPIRRHARRLRERETFHDVRVGFWKEEPSFRDVLRTVEGDKVYAVPVFTSEGYFVDDVIQRELGLPREGVTYTQPVGTHPSMTDVVVDRAISAYGGTGEEAALVLVGHGTERNPKSADAVRRHAAEAEERGVFGEVETLFMDEPPYVDCLTEHVDSTDFVVVPFFISDGYHTQEDIPEDIGITDGEGDYEVPATADGKRVWYTGAIGTDAGVVEVISENIEGADEPEGLHEPSASDAVDWFRGRVEGGTRWGEIAVVPRGDGYGVRNVADTSRSEAGLTSIDTLAELRSVVDTDDEGRYRPMDGEDTLPTGWRLSVQDASEAVEAVRRVYPATVVNGYLADDGEVDVTPWSETASRQTGMYADVDELDGDALRCATEAVCARCVKSPDWRSSQTEPSEGTALTCTEACSFFIAAAREFLGTDDTETDTEPVTDEHSVRRGEVSDPANEYKRRYSAVRGDG